MMDRIDEVKELYQARIDALSLTSQDNDKNLLVNIYGRFTMNKKEYSLLIEYNYQHPEEGIYYGCKCEKTENMSRDEIDNDWKEIIPQISDIICKKALLSPYGIEQGSYWPFWIRLDENEPTKIAPENMEMIKHYLDKKKDEYGIVFSN
jgi:hypothetical protein